MDYNELFTSIDDIDKILKSYEPDLLVKLCTYLIKQYILKEGINFDIEVEDINNGKSNKIKEINNFSELVKEIQRKYNFPELQKFIVEQQNVFIISEDKKILLNIENNNSIKNNDSSRNIIQNKLEIKKNKPNNINNESQNRFRSLEIDE